MKINIETCTPDGLIISITDVYVDTFEEAFKIIKAIEKVK